MGFKYEEDRTFIVCPRDKVEIVVNGKVYGADAEVRVQLRPTELYLQWQVYDIQRPCTAGTDSRAA